jgi:hypothetical protein
MLIALIIVLSIWEVYWTYQACWLASQRDEKRWFLLFLVFNLLGIPEILYLRKRTKVLNSDTLLP